MINFLCGFGVGICLSLVYFVAINLFKQHPSWTNFLDMKEHLADIKKKLDDLLKKVSPKNKS